jgi:hypothetical protein
VSRLVFGPRRAVSVAASVVAAVGIAVALGGCGKSGPDKAEQADTACGPALAKAAALTAPASLDAAKTAVTTLVDGADAARRAVAVTQPTLAGPLGEAHDVAVRLAARVESGDFGGMETVGAELRDATAAVDAKARAVRSPACGKGLNTGANAVTSGLVPLLKPALVAKADGLCAAEKQAINALPPPEKTNGGLYGYLRDQQKLASKLMVDLHALNPPAADKAAWQTFVDATERLVNQLEELARAAAFNDQPRFNAAREVGNKLGGEADTAAAAFGLKECRS